MSTVFRIVGIYFYFPLSQWTSYHYLRRLTRVVDCRSVCECLDEKQLLEVYSFLSPPPFPVDTRQIFCGVPLSIMIQFYFSIVNARGECTDLRKVLLESPPTKCG